MKIEGPSDFKIKPTLGVNLAGVRPNIDPLASGIEQDDTKDTACREKRGQSTGVASFRCVGDEGDTPIMAKVIAFLSNG